MIDADTTAAVQAIWPEVLDEINRNGGGHCLDDATVVGVPLAGCAHGATLTVQRHLTGWVFGSPECEARLASDSNYLRDALNTLLGGQWGINFTSAE